MPITTGRPWPWSPVEPDSHPRRRRAVRLLGVLWLAIGSVAVFYTIVYTGIGIPAWTVLLIAALGALLLGLGLLLQETQPRW